MHGNSKDEQIRAWIKRMASEAIDQHIATRLRWEIKIGLTAELFDIVEWRRQRVRR